jgi:hypothetical protein
MIQSPSDDSCALPIQLDGLQIESGATKVHFPNVREDFSIAPPVLMVRQVFHVE